MRQEMSQIIRDEAGPHVTRLREPKCWLPQAVWRKPQLPSRAKLVDGKSASNGDASVAMDSYHFPPRLLYHILKFCLLLSAYDTLISTGCVQFLFTFPKQCPLC